MSYERGCEPSNACTMHPLEKVCKAGRSRTHFWQLHGLRNILRGLLSRHFVFCAKLTMFKRVDRRCKRKEEEEELGLDEEEREILGLNNTDSSESDSDSSSSSSAQAPSRRNKHSKNKRKWRASRSPHDKSDDDEDSQSASGDEGTDGDDILAGHIVSIASALKEPIQLIRTHPEAWVCVFCPNKVLKHAAMVKVHEASQARKLQT